MTGLWAKADGFGEWDASTVASLAFALSLTRTSTGKRRVLAFRQVFSLWGVGYVDSAFAVFVGGLS
jgi:hypothetical protein